MNTNVATISNLTPLRGLAAMMVAIYHFDSVCANFVDAKTTMILGKSYLMVDLFFIMSGFIILHVYGGVFATKIAKKDYWQYLGARFARIYPLHVFTLLFTVLAYYLKNEPPSPINDYAAIPSHLLLLHSMGLQSIFTWNVPSWSISAEWWAYVIFPILSLYIVRYKRSGWIVLSALSLALYLAIMYWLPRVNPFDPTALVPHNLDVTYDYGWLRGIAGFIAGMVVYIGYKSGIFAKFLKSDFAGFIMFLLMLILMHIGANDILIVAAFASVVWTFSMNKGQIYSFLQNKVFQFLGDISYSIYLMHGFIMFFVAVPIITAMGNQYRGPGSVKLAFGNGTWICIIYLIAIIIVSTLSYYFVEKPCREKLKQLFAR